ncbi:MAG: 30S ribosomal protein S12 methylthiotransferase RimO [Bacteroidales bacterium]|nr:30S ribosomal protein S12 methylthiotransferase RimO [Bacteroidota bacterium]MBL6950387.1 30S ribosomal protein S12 methylthiotransferase RimO [Bacteroidales bacterium]
MNSQRKKKRIGLISLGCAKNLVDSEVLLKQLESSRIEIDFEPRSLEDIQAIVINTCGFIGDAKQESVDKILQYVNAKRQGVIERIYLMGCLTERYRNELEREIPEADGIYGINELPVIIRELGGEYRINLLGERYLTTPSHYAYIKIAEGCDRSCSFCAIPMIRGTHRSRPMEEIIREANYLSDQGVKELLVISQDTTFYGIDIYSRRTLAELLRKLALVKGIEWIRLHYAYPHAFPMEVLNVIREHPTICNYVDIPLQHINSRILRSMKRGITGDKTRKLIDKIREKIPGVSLRTTFITGYPGEKDEDVEELIRFLEQVKFDRVGMFAYSHEEGTAAFSLKDSIPAGEKQKRVAMLMNIQEEISFQLNQQKIGHTLRVLIDKKEGDSWVGRTEADSPEVDQEVLISDKSGKLEPGRFCDVTITEAGHFDLIGESTF